MNPPEGDAVEVTTDRWDPWEDWDGWEDAYRWRDAPQPRWTPDRPLAERITRLGRWRDVDPAREGRLWNVREWAAFGLWGTLLTGAFAVAWRRARPGG